MVGGGAQDILDDSALFDVVRSFLESQSDHNIFQQSASWGDPAVKQAWDALTHQREALKGIFVSHTLRAPISRAQPRPREKANGSAIQGANAAARRKQLASREMPDIDQIDPEELVDSLDGMAAAAFSNVTDEVSVVNLSFVLFFVWRKGVRRTGWRRPWCLFPCCLVINVMRTLLKIGGGEISLILCCFEWSGLFPSPPCSPRGT